MLRQSINTHLQLDPVMHPYQSKHCFLSPASSLLAFQPPLLVLVSFLIINCVMSSMAECPVKAAYWLAAESSTFPAYRINGCLFNHLFCGFAVVSRTSYEVELPSPTVPFETFSKIVKVCRHVKTILSIGGKNSQLETFANMASRSDYRQRFIVSSINLARKYGFDGLHLYWVYPRNQAEMQNLGTLLVEWRSAIDEEAQSSGRPRLLLTAAVYFSPIIPPTHPTDDPGGNYPTDQMARKLDWVNVIAYDLTDPSRSPNATAAPAPLPSVNDGIIGWLEHLPSCQVVLGLPFYGYAWILADPNQHGIGARADGPYGRCNGFETYAEIKKLLEQGFNHVYDAGYVTDYCYQEMTWVAYDGPTSIQRKVSYAKNEKGLLGYFGFTVGWDSDDAELARTAHETWA